MDKKMTKEDYLRKKGILPEKDLGSIYTFQSSPDGVSEIKEILVWEKRSSNGYFYKDNIKTDYIIQRYSLKESPYELEIVDGEVVGERSFSGSGFGDLWSYSHFGSFDKNALEEAREKEKQRIEKKIWKKN